MYNGVRPPPAPLIWFWKSARVLSPLKSEEGHHLRERNFSSLELFWRWMASGVQIWKNWKGFHFWKINLFRIRLKFKNSSWFDGSCGRVVVSWETQVGHDGKSDHKDAGHEEEEGEVCDHREVDKNSSCFRFIQRTFVHSKLISEKQLSSPVLIEFWFPRWLIHDTNDISRSTILPPAQFSNPSDSRRHLRESYEKMQFFFLTKIELSTESIKRWFWISFRWKARI